MSPLYKDFFPFDYGITPPMTVESGNAELQIWERCEVIHGSVDFPLRSGLAPPNLHTVQLLQPSSWQ